MGMIYLNHKKCKGTPEQTPWPCDLELCSKIEKMMLKQILDMLACPVPTCRKPLKLAEDESALQCTVCGKTYPIKDGIPILLVD
jgi:uncharacterized protein YbaR (Trm112 family)